MIKSIPIKNLLIISFLVFSIIPTLVLSIIFFYVYNLSINEEVESRLASASEKIETFIYSSYNDLKNTSQRLKSNRAFLFAVETQSLSDLERLANFELREPSLNKIAVYDEYKRNIFTADKQNEKVTTKVDDNVLDFHIPSGIESGADSYSGDNIEKFEVIQNEKISISYIEPVFTSAQELRGFLLLGSRYNYNEVENLYLDEDINFRILPYSNCRAESKSEGSLSGFSMRCMALSDLPELGIILSLNMHKYQDRKRTILISILISILIIFILIVPTIIYFSRQIIKPLGMLSKATMVLADEDDFVPIAENSQVEMSMLTKNFNEMAKRLKFVKSELKNKIIDLQVANKKIQEAQLSMVQNAKMAGLGQLVAGVAHELNNPVAYIYSNMDHLEESVDKIIEIIDASNSEKMKDWKKKEDWPFLKKDLLKIIDSCRDGAERTTSIIKDLRSFSRLDKGKRSYVFIEDLIENSLRLLKSKISDKIKIELHLDRKKEVLCNPNQINQVVMNLIHNALDAMPKGGLLKISTKSTTKGFELIVEDSGVGISESDLEKIFDPYFTTKDIGKGTGLGLSITYSIIEEHGGKLEVKSKLGQGSTFRALLP